MPILPRLLIALCLVPLLSQAVPLTQLTLPDGREVQLNDDFTWEYLLVKPATVAPEANKNTAVAKAVAVPVVSESVTATEAVVASGGSAALTEAAAPVLTEQALAKPELLSQAARDGVSVALSQLAGEDPLQLTFTVSNGGSNNVVRVRGRIILFNARGVQLASEEVRFWVGENRLPESYLRKGEQRPSRIIELARPAALDGKPLVRVQIDEVEFR